MTKIDKIMAFNKIDKIKFKQETENSAQGKWGQIFLLAYVIFRKPQF